MTCNKNPTWDNSLWYVETNTHPLRESLVPFKRVALTQSPTSSGTRQRNGKLPQTGLSRKVPRAARCHVADEPRADGSARVRFPALGVADSPTGHRTSAPPSPAFFAVLIAATVPQNFWVKEQKQVYLIGNPVTWWTSTLAVLAYLGLRTLLVLREKRGYRDLERRKSDRPLFCAARKA